MVLSTKLDFLFIINNHRWLCNRLVVVPNPATAGAPVLCNSAYGIDGAQRHIVCPGQQGHLGSPVVSTVVG